MEAGHSYGHGSTAWVTRVVGVPDAPEPPGSEGTTTMVGDVVSGAITISLCCNLVPCGHWHQCGSQEEGSTAVGVGSQIGQR